MPIPEERLYNSEKINIWFALSSLLMTGSILWMIYVDYDRPWRAFQDSYSVAKAALAHLDYLDATRDERQQEIAVAKARLADAIGYLDRTGGQKRADLETQHAEADLEFKKVDAPWSRVSQVLEVTRDTYERTLGRLGTDHALTKAALDLVRKEEIEEEELRGRKEHWEDKRRSIEDQLKTLTQEVQDKRKQVTALEEAAKAAVQKDRQYRGVLPTEGLLGDIPVIKAIINMPLFDFVAPKTTPARHQVKQLVLPDIHQRLNYLETYTTDRCTTCHVAINDPEFSRDRLARKLERSLLGISDERERAGLDRIEPPTPPTLEDGTTLPMGRVTEHWAELNREQQDEYFAQLLSLVNDYLTSDGRKAIRLDHPLLAHPDLDLYVDVKSPHPMAKVGCTVCHEGNPQETDFVQAAHSPPTHEVEETWREEYYIHQLGIPNVTFETIAHYWDRPMLLPKHTEAGCAKCHSRVSDIARFDGRRIGTKINLGRHLFTQVGCINCHNVDELADSRRVGPDLAYVASKLKRKFVQQWVFSPQDFRPSTRMPHFFMQENNDAHSANQFDRDPTLRTETEVAAISHYLYAVSKSWSPIEKPDDVIGDADRGRTLFRTVGCLGCHANIAEFGEEWISADLEHRLGLGEETARHRYKGMTYEQRVRYAMEHFVNERDTFFHPAEARFDPNEQYHTPIMTRFGPELSGIGSKVTADWLYSWLTDPQNYSAETMMPSLRLTPAEAADIAAYLMTLKHDAFEQREFEMTPARRDMADELMFTLLSAQRSANRSHAIMEDQGGELTATLVSFIEASLGKNEAYDLVSAMTLEDKKLLFLGNKAIAHYGCYACHTIRGFESTTPPGTDLTGWAEKPISQLDFAFYGHAFHHMREEQEETYGFIYPREAEHLNNASPLDDMAREEITHTHAAFATHKMLNPRIWDRGKIKRPYDKLKMPNYYFTQEEADALTTYLLSRVPPRVSERLRIDYDTDALGPIAKGRTLARELNCLGCHEIEDNVPTIQQYFRRTIGGELTFDSINAPPSLWGEGAKLQHHWFHRFLQNVEPLRPWLQVRMPSFNLTGEQATTLVEYFAALSQQDSAELARALPRIDEYLAAAESKTTDETPAKDKEGAGSDWYQQESLEHSTSTLTRWAIERKLMRPSELDPLKTSADRLRKSHKKLLDRVRFVQKLYDVKYPFVEPPQPLSTKDRFDLGSRFLNDMGCLQCHVLGRMLPGPAKTTDDFVQVYRLDSVRGDGDDALAFLNGTAYSIGSKIDGHTLISASNVYNETGDVTTSAIVEGPGPAGERERIMLQAASAPNLDLTHQRLRRRWVYDWMLEPQLMQPGTKMPQNFRASKDPLADDPIESPFAGDPNYPGTGADHINLLVDYLYDAGTTNARAPLLKIVAVEEEEFDEGEDFDDEEFDD